MLLTSNATVTIKRIGTGAKRSYNVTVGSFDVHIEPIQEELEPIYADQGGGQVFRMFMDETDIQIGDQIVNGSKKYKVEGVKIYDTIFDTHTESIIRDTYD